MEWMLNSFFYLRMAIVWVAFAAALVVIFKGIFFYVLRRKKARPRFWVNFCSGIVYLLVFGYLLGAVGGAFADIAAIIYLMIVVFCTQFNREPGETRQPKLSRKDR